MKFGSKQKPISPHSLVVCTGESVAQGVPASVPLEFAGLYCTTRTWPPLRITNSRPEPSGAQPRPVSERLESEMKAVSLKVVVSTGVAEAAPRRSAKASASDRTRRRGTMAGKGSAYMHGGGKPA